MNTHSVRVVIAVGLFGAAIATAQDGQQLAKYIGTYEQANVHGPIEVTVQEVFSLELLHIIADYGSDDQGTGVFGKVKLAVQDAFGFSRNL